MRRLWQSVVLFVMCSVALPVVVIVTILGTFLFVPFLPVTLRPVKAGIESQISRVFDADGREIAVLTKFEQNIPVRKADIPTILKQAVISAEDQNFYGHGGFDVRGTLRALWNDVRGNRIQGGSTITQQYVKNASEGIGRSRSIVRKVKEAIEARNVDRKYDKEEILFRYLSTIYLGEGATGVGAASETYFRKPVSQLTISEAALLTGLIPAPSFYEPRGNPEGADSKRILVLGQMLEQGYISQQQHDEAAAQHVWLAARGNPPGPATVVYPRLQQYRKYPYFVDYVEKYLVAKYGAERVDRGGLRIQTTLDPRLQAAAERAVGNVLAGTTPPLEMSLASVEPQTGFVKALVGGRDFHTGPYANVNLALANCPAKPTDPEVKIDVAAECWEHPEVNVRGGAPGRQTGSAWKPFTLTAAFEAGFLPTKTYPAPGTYRIPNCRGEHCEIGNNEGRGGGSANIRTATAKSINTVYAQIARDVGVDKVAEVAKRLGVTGAWYAPRIHGSPTTGLSYTLGVLDTSTLDMASAYGVFAARGLRQVPTPVVRVLDNQGRVLEDNSEREPKRVLGEVVADNVTDVLRGVIGGGTGTAADIGRPAAGKTGSSQFNANAWFVGYTPTLSTAVWMGKADGQGPAQALLRIKGVPRVYGGTIPARTWKAFTADALKDVHVTDFNEPAPIRDIADALRRRSRAGFDPGDRRGVAEVGPGGQYEFDLPPPTVDMPTTTTTTRPEEFDEDDDGDGGGILFPRP